MEETRTRKCILIWLYKERFSPSLAYRCAKQRTKAPLSSEALYIKDHHRTELRSTARTMSLRYRHLLGDYWLGVYGDFDIIVNNKGFFNATKFCEQFGKTYEQWFELPTSKGLIDACKKHISPPVEEAEPVENDYLRGTYTSERIMGDNIYLEGDYVHLLLLPHIAFWLSPEFAIKGGAIVNTFFVQALAIEPTEYVNQTKDREEGIQRQRKQIISYKPKKPRAPKKQVMIIKKNIECDYPYIFIEIEEVDMDERLKQLKLIYPMSTMVLRARLRHDVSTPLYDVMKSELNLKCSENEFDTYLPDDVLNSMVTLMISKLNLGFIYNLRSKSV